VKQEELDNAFAAALKTWNEQHLNIDYHAARFFFFDGATFGTKCAATIYAEAYGIDVEGVPV
jgi:hypothetical protein